MSTASLQSVAEPAIQLSGQPASQSAARLGVATAPHPAELVQASSREMEKQIVDKILGQGYDKRIRPAGSGPHNASSPGEFTQGWPRATQAARINI